MQIVQAYPDGLFNWVDLTTTDIAGAKAFYTALFGWEAVDLPTGMGTDYTMFRIAGYNVAGAGPMPAEMQEQGIPSFWACYIKHDDVDAVAERITAAGGTLLMPPIDVMEEGRMVMAADPGRAVFGVWQPRNHIGAQIVNAANSLVWNELQTHDLAAAQAFYEAVFGWTCATNEDGYVSVAANGRFQAGMMAIRPEWGETPPNWSVYFMVDDLAAKVAQAQELGGNALVPSLKVGEMGELAVLQDPQGGVFTIMAFQGSIDPPPGY
jgi:uncharacterized protein